MGAIACKPEMSKKPKITITEREEEVEEEVSMEDVEKAEFGFNPSLRDDDILEDFRKNWELKNDVNWATKYI
jgi:hypothetical protein